MPNLSQENPEKCEESATFDPLKRFELDRLLRYGYAGFLMIGILLFVVPGKVGPVLAAGGTVVTPLVVLAAGAAVYTLYRYVFNEMLWVRRLHRIHAFLDKKRRVPIPTNPANYLVKEWNVPVELGHDAYVEVRRGFFSKQQRASFDRNHTEATIVYLTGVECSIAGCILFVVQVDGMAPWKPWLLLVSGVLTFIAAINLDLRLFRHECRILAANPQELPKFLRDHGLTLGASSAADAGQR